MFAKAATLRLPDTYGSRLLAVITLVVVLAVIIFPAWRWYSEERVIRDTVAYPRTTLLNPLIAGTGAALLIYAAIRQARTANQRHEAQTKADQQRRITESFSKAIEQLGSDKLEVRLGGIYALERISQESLHDYLTVMENLTAFVRERTQRTEAEQTAKPREKRIAECAYLLWEKAGRPEGRSEEFWREAADRPEVYEEPPPTDIEAVLTVIRRRSEEHRALEVQEKRFLDFGQAVLRCAILSKAHLESAFFRKAHLEGAHLIEAHLEGAILSEAYLEGAHLNEAHLEGAFLFSAHLERAILFSAHLEGAFLFLAHLEGAHLNEAHLEGAILSLAHLEGAHLNEAHFEGANLSSAEGLTQEQIGLAFGDAETELPEKLTRPVHWAESERGAAPVV
jgi:uncharacterized protein YjbI with pentapeptide repeats